MKFDNKFEIFFEKFTNFWGDDSYDLLSLSNDDFTEFNFLIKDYQYDKQDEETKQALIKKLAEAELSIMTLKKLLGEKEVEKEIEELMKNELKHIKDLSKNKTSNEECENEQI